MSPENNIAPPTSQKRIDANRRNAQKSTGPTTPEGKSRSRFNGLRHGLAATVPVLPGEDPAAFQARVDAVIESCVPQNQVEFDLLERVAATTWSLERANRAETAQLCHKIRHDAIEREQKEKEVAVALGQRLLWDARGPWQLFPHSASTGESSERRTSWSENPADPNNPALLVLRLERTVAGCRWLLERWAELRARLEPGEMWAAPDQFKALRLLGKQPMDAVDDPDVTQIFLAGFRLLPDGTHGNPFAPLKSELSDGNDEQNVYYRELKKRPLAKLTPPDADAARAVLTALVDRQTSRLELILARNQEIALADAAEAPDRLAFDPSPEGEKLRRYVLSAARSVNQTIKTYLSVVSCQLSVVKEDTPSAPEHHAGRGSSGTRRLTAPGVTEGLRPDSPTEPNVVPDETSDNGQSTDPTPGVTEGLRPDSPTEPDAVLGETSDNGQSTDHAPGVTEGLRPDSRTEPNAVPDAQPDNGQRTTDNGQSTDPTPGVTEGLRPDSRTEPNAVPDAQPDNVRRTTYHGQSTDAAPGVTEGLRPDSRTEPNAIPDAQPENETRTTDNRLKFHGPNPTWNRPRSVVRCPL